MLRKNDLATLALFGAVGPFLGMIYVGLPKAGLSSLIMPLLFIPLLALAGFKGLGAFVVLMVIPAVVSGGAVVLARNLRVRGFAVAAGVLAGAAANVVAHLLVVSRLPDRGWIMTGAMVSLTLALLDCLLRRRYDATAPT
ncbi:hypothetical protein G7077_05365 [Sphingomonas piscis]|uniref:Uncharacterized protein n=1 Tax=Sphingomonas piscis TaxID=2714943 RepID=A0A6G7YNV2_9SPHN|nr:hypothetical protein [Sphingomonas piscis]QIK78419.1 hypothetical protein G7077_05365 [Sphingomonas piscis]